MHPFPESIIAIHSVDRVCKAVDKFQKKAFACTEARPLQVDCLRICVKLFFYWLIGKAGPVAPQAHTVADGEAPHRRHRKTHNPTFPGRQRSEKQTSELQTLMRNLYAVLCLIPNNNQRTLPTNTTTILTIDEAT